jgi:UDP-N-acetylglucosamine diphosphorylase/glucosamine-1-phosphate N-acetyltransferase
MKNNTVSQAIVLAAGRGERLYPLTTLRPKVMLPIGNKPILQYVIEALVANDIRNIVIVVGYQQEKVQDYFMSGDNFGASIQYVMQAQQLGTANALLAAASHLEDQFLVVQGHNWIAADTIKDLLSANMPTISVTNKAQGHTQHRSVNVRNGKVLSFLESPADPITPWVNTGTYLLDKSIVDHLENELDLPNAINKLINTGAIINAQPTTGIWGDAIYPRDLHILNGLVLSNIDTNNPKNLEPGVVIKGPVKIDKNSIIRANSYIIGPVVIGEGCEIGPSVTIFPYTSIGNNVVIESFTYIRNCIIGNSVHVSTHSHLTDTVIADGVTLGPRFTAKSDFASVINGNNTANISTGCVIGDNVTIGANVSIKAGVLLGHGATIREGKTIAEDIPELSNVI